MVAPTSTAPTTVSRSDPLTTRVRHGRRQREWTLARAPHFMCYNPPREESMHRTTKAVSLNRWALLAESPINQRSAGRLSCVVENKMTPSEEERFWPKVLVMENCWEWIGVLNPYAGIRIGGKMRKAHRVSYEHFKGSIPEGLELDHLCRNVRCVNPDHLEPVTHRENVRRGARVIGGFCSYGHRMTLENTMGRSDNRGGVRCRTCHQDKSELWRKSHPEVGAASQRRYRERHGDEFRACHAACERARRAKRKAETK